MLTLSRFLLIGACLCVTSTISAQGGKEPRRPTMAAGADTNDAHAYYAFAVDIMANDPDKAADALYWTTRLEPTWADGFYARRVALHLSDPSRLLRYWGGDRRTIQSNDVRRIDSLFYHALTLNPFVSQRLDRTLFEGVANEIASRYERQGAGSSTAVRYAIDRQMLSAPVADKAWMAYGDGRFDDALRLYAEAVQQDARNGPLRVDRARVFVQTGQPDSALAELTLAIADMRKRDKKELIYVYQSKALTEHSIGVVEEQLGHADAAREAYGRALQEDLSYYPAHLALSYLALEAKDTTTALSEMELVVQLESNDPATQYLYGYALAGAGRSAEAEAHLRKAIELDAVYSPPHLALAGVLERLKRPGDAAAEYTAFLARAARTDNRRGAASARLAALSPLSGGERR